MDAIRASSRLLVAHDETDIKVHEEWVYLYRAVDKHGRTVDFGLSEHRDIEAAKQFFRQALRNNRPPRIVALDAYRATHRALRLLRREHPAWRRARMRTCRYLNNIVEEGRRGIKSRTGPMLGSQLFTNAATTIAGIELIRRIKKASSSSASLQRTARPFPKSGRAVLAA
jgi:transposase-like protein